MGDTRLRTAIAGLVKVCLNARLLALLLTVLWLPSAAPEDLNMVTALLAVVGITSLAPILAWDRLGPWILDHPATLLIDLGVTMLVLALVGLETPFGLFVLSTALVAGVLYGWAGAGVMSLALIAVYGGGAMLGQSLPTMAEVLGTPALVPAAAAGGAALRVLMVRQYEATSALAEASLNGAAAVERTRLAREMHDTLAKTLHGIALSATAVPRLLDEDPDTAAVAATQLAEVAEQAAREARALIVDLRTDDLEQPLGPALRDAAEQWARRTGVAVMIDVDDCAGASPSVRYELFCIAREALRNGHEHGGARRMTVVLRDDDPIRLTVTDDGRGFVVPPDLNDLAAGGHFGVIGMAERAATVGGLVTVDSSPGHGTTVVASVPRVAPGEREGQLPPHRSWEVQP